MSALSRRRTLRLNRRTALALAAGAVALVLWRVDLTPRVETDFFFARDDPQYVASATIAARFGDHPQIIINVAAPDPNTTAYRTTIGAFAATLAQIPGIRGVQSIANRDPSTPLWRRVLLAPDGGSTNLLVDVSPRASLATVIRHLETTSAAFANDTMAIHLAGVPYAVERIRANLQRDLAVFSVAALVVFGAIVALVYRSTAIVIGTVSACLGAAATTLLLARLAGASIGLLTANIVTIVFVLTLSHIVFLTANWRDSTSDDPVSDAIARTRVVSFWCMTTTLLGFASLFLASAKPLRQLGLAGAIGAATALVVAYTLFPPFLRSLRSSALPRWPGALRVSVPATARLPIAIATPVVVLLFAAGMRSLDTDPSLLSYFAAGDPIRTGLAAVDRNGGSSPLSIVVRDSAGRPFDDPVVVPRLHALQTAFERDAAVGSAISVAVILAELRASPLAAGRSYTEILDLVDQTPLRVVVGGYLAADRREGLYFLRMHEAGRVGPRDAIVDRLEGIVSQHGFDAVLVGGLYDQQHQLGTLIASSLRWGLGGLVGLFLAIAYLVSRSPRVTTTMVMCLAAIPCVVLGTLGWLSVPVDIISSPAANVALAMGVDAMIHLMMRARALAAAGQPAATAWPAARHALAPPILGAGLIIAAGFGIFALSSFPPTRTFGLAVVLGTAVAAVMAVGVLPVVAAGRR